MSPREVNEIIGAYVDQENLEKAIMDGEFEYGKVEVNQLGSTGDE